VVELGLAAWGTTVVQFGERGHGRGARGGGVEGYGWDGDWVAVSGREVIALSWSGLLRLGRLLGVLLEGMGGIGGGYGGGGGGGAVVVYAGAHG
jgi:hypothetical protein